VWLTTRVKRVVVCGPCVLAHPNHYGPGAYNGYFLYHNDYKAGWQAEEDLGFIGADNYTIIPRTAPAQGSRLKGSKAQRLKGTRGPPRPIGGPK
jgi:hypothetical protein